MSRAIPQLPLWAFRTCYWANLLVPIQSQENAVHILQNYFFKILSTIKIAIPLQPWTGPEGSRRLRLPDFKTIGT
jgi:hypothetical protein